MVDLPSGLHLPSNSQSSSYHYQQLNSSSTYINIRLTDRGVIGILELLCLHVNQVLLLKINIRFVVGVAALDSGSCSVRVIVGMSSSFGLAAN